MSSADDSSDDSLPTGTTAAEPAGKADTTAAAPSKLKNTVSGYIQIADRCRDARNWEGARTNYEEALALNPSLQPIWIQLGHARKESGDHAAAEEAYREALKLKPGDADVYLQLGHLYKIRNQMGMALESYMRAMDLDPLLGDARVEVDRLRERVSQQEQRTASRSVTPMASRYPRQAKAADSKSLNIVFDVSDLMHYFRNARLPTGIQRVQMEVITKAFESADPNTAYSIVCFTRDTDFWIEVPRLLFERLCRQAVLGGDHKAPEWTALLSDLDSVLDSRHYFSFARGSVLLNLGTSWWLQNYFLNVRLAKSLYGIKYVPFVHDFIPVMAPEHCVAELRQDFITWAIGAFDHADFFLANSKATLADLQAVGKKMGYGPRTAAVITLDADFRKTLSEEMIASEIGDASDYLRSVGLEKGNYVLFVSTIESRKNHIAAFSVWLKLIKTRGIKNVPKLVCVGNPGWLNDATYAKLNASELLSDHVLMLSKISDAALSVLYENCVCTLYPSSYEGWGLPVTEALCYGKVPVISNVSSLPEAGGPFAEYFDAESEKDLLEAIVRVVYDEKFRARRELKIISEFRPRSWGDISKQIVGQLREWAKAPTPAPIVPSTAYGIWPVEADMGVLHTLASNHNSTLWAGLKSGEIYRNGPGWWWPEYWGCWIKGTGPSQIAFVLRGVANSPVQIYIGLRGAQSKTSTATLKCEGVRPVITMLGPEQDKTVSFVLPASPEVDRLVVINITSDTAVDFRMSSGGKDFRSCGVGVRWLYACNETDVPARLRMIEAIALNDYARLERQPPEFDFFLHT
ncbi:MAG TPA: glycosyltransferase [Rhizomicrobium sp.]|nr:glycosyltransferase [Rhizomicrobium sp.]